MNYSPEGWKTSPLTTSKPLRCGWTHAWLVELACRPSQFPALAVCLCLLSEGQWIRTSPPRDMYTHTHLAGRSAGAPHSCQRAHPARFITASEFCIWGLARGKRRFWRCEWQAALPYHRTAPYSWADSNSGLVRGFLQKTEEDAQARSDLRRLSRCNAPIYMRSVSGLFRVKNIIASVKTNDGTDCLENCILWAISPACVWVHFLLPSLVLLSLLLW